MERVSLLNHLKTNHKMALINDVDTLRQYVTVGNDLNFQSIKPSLFTAEQKYLRQFLGGALYTFLVENAANTAYARLIGHAQNVAAKFALWLYIIPGGVQIDDAGIYMAKTTDMWRLSPQEIGTLRLSYLEEAMDALELMLEELEENVSKPSQSTLPQDYNPYELWHESATRKRYAGLFINSGHVFSEYVELYRSNLTFFMMHDIIRRVELHTIAPLLGDYYATLKGMTEIEGPHLILYHCTLEAIAMLAAAQALAKGFHFFRFSQLTMSFQPEKLAPEQISKFYVEAQNSLERLRAKLEELQPAGYTPLSGGLSDPSLLRKPGSRIILA